MRIVIRSGDVRLWLPVPLSLASAAVSLLPESVFLSMQKSVPEPYRGLVAKEFLREIVQESLSVLKQYKGLELVHVEAQDGTYVSIRL